MSADVGGVRRNWSFDYSALGGVAIDAMVAYLKQQGVPYSLLAVESAAMDAVEAYCRYDFPDDRA